MAPSIVYELAILIRRLLITPLLVICTLVLSGQTRVYNTEFGYPSDMVANIQSGHVNIGMELMWSKALLSVRQDYIYDGFSSSGFDALYVIRDGQLYLGDSQFSNDILYTFRQGKIYRGDSEYMMDQLYTFEQGKLYQGNSTLVFDFLLMFDSEPTLPELFAILLALELL
jgi:hypothetical protein